MKKSIYSEGKALALILTISLLVPILASCKLYDGDYKKSGDFEFKLNKKETFGTVTAWQWDGIVIDALGGSYGTNAPLLVFSIETDCDIKFKSLEAEYKVPVSYDKIVFTLKLGKNIGAIHTQYYSEHVSEDVNYVGVTQEDGSVIFYQVFFEVECSKENKTFYSKKGKLYTSKDDKRVGGIPHMDDLK